jgi:hypothetical protein
MVFSLQMSEYEEGLLGGIHQVHCLISQVGRTEISGFIFREATWEVCKVGGEFGLFSGITC